MRRIISAALSALKYMISVFFIYAGIQTALLPTDTIGFVYSDRAFLVILGLWFFLSGAGLLLSKIKKYDQGVGRSLLSMYCAFLFASILNGFQHDWVTSAWLPNLVASCVIGALYLRWKYHILYFPPRPRQQIIDDFMKDSDESTRGTSL